ncbi:unnamed protein product [Ambrosiozyma monospora]|uniref:Unnamed protein product n=1 Tax=Ambrosiozyma monospora TaxID=43982 RepID=A0ACB5T044_AMBMO|nr:unnamed protein product [Ambrosiozyma monospora]
MKKKLEKVNINNTNNNNNNIGVAGIAKFNSKAATPTESHFLVRFNDHTQLEHIKRDGFTIDGFKVLPEKIVTYDRIPLQDHGYKTSN